MVVFGGEVSIIATKPFQSLNAPALFVFALHHMFGLFSLTEYEYLKKYDDNNSLLENVGVSFDGISYVVLNNNYNEIYPAMDFF